MSTIVRPYGDHTGDGAVQMSFTLPVAYGEEARQAASALLKEMGFERIHIVHMKAMGTGHTFVIAYGATTHSVDLDTLEGPEHGHPELSYPEVNRLIREKLKRRLVVVGACTGTDAHTVGLDAILSMKGFAGDKGLEYFPEIQVVNMGAQVTPEEIVSRIEEDAVDAVLISQVVTQRDAHILHLKEVRNALVAAGQRDRLVLVGGGPRFDPAQASDLGYDRIFGRGTLPSEVASYLAWAVTEKVPA